jgi:deoxyribose-phosphate aldolase
MQPMARENSGRLTIADCRVEAPQKSRAASGSGSPTARLADRVLRPNRGIPLDLDWLDRVRLNTSAGERRTQSNTVRYRVKKEWAPWLLRAIRCMDLTTLSEDDTEERVKRLCAKARQRLPQELLTRLGIEEVDFKVAAVSVYPRFVETALRALAGSGIHVDTVAAGFPTGVGTLEERVAEIRQSMAAGAEEIDVVIRRTLVLDGKWQELYDEIAQFRRASSSLPLKVILGTGELRTQRNVACASLVAMMAGADFIKTSTGKELVNATLPASLVMVRAIRDYAKQTGMAVGFKPAGGIRTAKQALEYLSLVNQELGASWMKPDLLRFGASSLLGDIERELEHFASGPYSGECRPDRTALD